MAENDYKEILQFATNDYFATLTPFAQKTIANAYLSIERNVASPSEVKAVVDYYNEAKAAFRGKQKPKKAPQTPPQLPRSDQLNGAAGKGEITNAELEHMLDTTDFDKIPEVYQRKLLGY